MRRIPVLTLAVIGLLPPSFFAAQLTLKDGKVLNGTFISGNSRTITFRDDASGNRNFNVSQIRSIDFDDQNTADRSSFADRRDQNRRVRNESSADRGYPDDNASYNSPNRTLPSGTEISVRTNEEIDSNTATEGRTYSALIDRDVMSPSGAVLIPRGSEAQMVIRQTSSGGVTGSPNLELDLQSVTVNGRRFTISTADLEQSNRKGLGANRRTAEMVGGGAALGTLLGAIAGGGKGAAIGAVVGAAGGGAVQVLTRGSHIQVPAETVLTFRLDQPLEMKVNR